jgi:hypothetical protein
LSSSEKRYFPAFNLYVKEFEDDVFNANYESATEKMLR